MARSLHYIIPLILLAACSKKENYENSDEEKKKVCDNIGKNANKEPGAIVQPPALPIIKTKVRQFDKVVFTSKANIVGGLNILSLQRAGLFKVAKNNLANWNMAALGMALLGLPPGSVMESLFFEADFKPGTMDIAGGRVHLMGNFKATDVFNKLTLLQQSGRLALTLNKTPKGFTTSYGGYKLKAESIGDNIISLSTGKTGTGKLSSNPTFQAMKKNIPHNTTLWFIAMSPPTFTGIPKVIRKNVAAITFMSGYLNISASRKLECQLRFRFKSADLALATKELIRLAASRGLNRLGPIITKSFNLDDAHNMNIVTRGPLLRIVFTLGRFQTSYLLRRLARLLRANSTNIPLLGGRLPPRGAMNSVLRTEINNAMRPTGTADGTPTTTTSPKATISPAQSVKALSPTAPKTSSMGTPQPPVGISK